jgi:hypothetical protein
VLEVVPKFIAINDIVDLEPDIYLHFGALKRRGAMRGGSVDTKAYFDEKALPAQTLDPTK